MVNDLEKRWTADDRTFHRVAIYVAAVLAVAALVFVITAIWAAERRPCAGAETMLCDTAAKSAILAGPTLVLMFGGIGAFVQTYREWRRGRSWPIWQGGGWFLFTMMIVYLGIGGGSVAG
ncbi:hypothetical protein [Nocardia sp. NPDC052112]|uniref:hypothetical protein n=1 Tax=Nocardia sp. NPDC052112 TaxID=3155646 RepID=UPI0034305F8A